MTPRLASFFVCLVAACGAESTPATPRSLVFAPLSAPQATSRDVFVGGSGDIVVMSARFSRDGGATWSPLDPRLVGLTRVAITGSVVTTYGPGIGLVRWDLATDQLSPIENPPAATSNGTWRVDPASGRLFVFDPVENVIAIEGPTGWTTSALPKPNATEPSPFIYDLESNGSVLLTVSAWGVHRSRDNGATWDLMSTELDRGRDILVLADRGFLLFGGRTSYAFDASGAPAGTRPGMVADIGDASACDDGAIIIHDQVSHDLGTTWQPLLSGGDLAPIVERIGCAGPRYWLLARSEAWGYRLVTITGGGPPLAAGNWEGDTTWNPSGPPITRMPDGTFLVAGLAWNEGDAGWRLREVPPRAWPTSEMVFGVTQEKLFASADLGATWKARAATGLVVGEAEALARTSDGMLLASAFTGNEAGDVDSLHAIVWQSTDDGASWTSAYDAHATRTAQVDHGEVHRFVGLAADGSWVATDAISRDAGKTWTETNVKNDHSRAFLTPTNLMVATLPTSAAIDDLWHVYADNGVGDLVATYRLAFAGSTIAASALGSVAFDEDGYAYVAGGAPYVQIWRSVEPIVPAE